VEGLTGSCDGSNIGRPNNSVHKPDAEQLDHRRKPPTPRAARFFGVWGQVRHSTAKRRPIRVSDD
jgi:hypothetical protein